MNNVIGNLYRMDELASRAAFHELISYGAWLHIMWLIELELSRMEY